MVAPSMQMARAVAPATLEHRRQRSVMHRCMILQWATSMILLSLMGPNPAYYANQYAYPYSPPPPGPSPPFMPPYPYYPPHYNPYQSPPPMPPHNNSDPTTPSGPEPLLVATSDELRAPLWVAASPAATPIAVSSAPNADAYPAAASAKWPSHWHAAFASFSFASVPAIHAPKSCVLLSNGGILPATSSGPWSARAAAATTYLTVSAPAAASRSRKRSISSHSSRTITTTISSSSNISSSQVTRCREET